MLSTVFTENEPQIQSIRHRLKNSTTAVRRIFGSDSTKELPIPEFINEYNHNMNNVDSGDQMQATYDTFRRRSYRGGVRSLAFGFLLNVVVINTFILQLKGKP